jgi:hypothetical protein
MFSILSKKYISKSFAKVYFKIFYKNMFQNILQKYILKSSEIYISKIFQLCIFYW